MLQHLPAAVPHPEVLDHGMTDGRAWTLTRWVPGEILADAWRAMAPADRDRFAGQLAEAVIALHEWSPAPEVRAALAQRPPVTSADEVIGLDVNPLPVDRALRLVDEAKRVPYADAGVVDAVADRLHELRPFDPTGADDVVLHGDLHLWNILEAGGSLRALLDFEWVRLGPPDLDLQAFLRADDDFDSLDLIPRLIASYPAIAAHPRVLERLWLYDLACTLRDLIVVPATTPPEHLQAHRPLRRLARIVRGPEYLEALLGGSRHD